jgi:hypothetical protein
MKMCGDVQFFQQCLRTPDAAGVKLIHRGQIPDVKLLRFFSGSGQSGIYFFHQV